MGNRAYSVLIQVTERRCTRTFEFTRNRCCFTWNESSIFSERDDIVFNFWTFKQQVNAGSTAAKKGENSLLFVEEEEYFFWITCLSSSWDRLTYVCYYSDWLTDSMLWRKHNFCQLLCLRLMPQQQLWALRSELRNRKQPVGWLLTWGMVTENRVEAGWAGIDFISFTVWQEISCFSRHACFVVCPDYRCSFCFFCFYLFLSIHCPWMCVKKDTVYK